MDRDRPINKSLLDGPVPARPSSSKKDKDLAGESLKNKKQYSTGESSRPKKRVRETTPTPRERSPKRLRPTPPVADEQPRILQAPTIKIPGLEMMMSELANKATGLVVENAWGFVKRHGGYLIFYKGYINEMKSKFRELNEKRMSVEKEVETAYRERLEQVKIEVQTWLDNVKKVEVEVDRITTGASVANNNRFHHFRLHYTLGSQAADQIQFIDKLLQQEREFNGVLSHSRPPPSTTGSLLVNEKYDMFESRKLYINEILEALKDEAVHKIGVYGMGGIGKTTLVKEAANKAMKDGLFTEVVMVTVSQNLDLKRIQTGIAESLRLELKEDTVQVRAGKIEERLMGKEGNRVLVILDDLWDMLELSKVRIPDPNYNQLGTCRVVITTRSKDVCNQMRCQKKVELKTLLDEESWSLFNSRAEINVVESPTLMKEVAWDVAKQCDGLPLALVVLGTALKDKELEVWKAVLNQLKMSTMASDLQGVSNKLRESIELSYKFLESEAAKWCFLHCCLYPEDYDIQEKDLMHMLVGGGLLEDVESLHEAQGRVHVLMDQLKASGLLLDGVNRQGKSIVRMHDVVRDVAIWIGKRDQYGFFVRAGQGLEEWPSTDANNLQNCRRLSLMSNKILNLPSDPIEFTKLETLILHKNRELSTIPEKFFQHMGALKVLDLSYTNISSLPESVSCLTSLKVLNLERCRKLRDISHINGLKMLEILIFKGNRSVSILPEDTAGGLLNLRMLDLGTYDSTPSLSSYFSNVLRGCSRLEQLFIPKYEGSLAELASLSFLTHLYIRDGVVDSNDSFSNDQLGLSRSWTKLQEFLICFRPSPCQCWIYLEDQVSSSLHLTRTKHFSPLLKVLLEKIDHLALVHCKESEVISIKCDIPPHVFHNLTHLVVSQSEVISLGDDESLLPNLKFMTVQYCPKLARLCPSKVWQSMHQKPMAMTQLLPKLVELNLYCLPQLESVLQPFQCLPNLMTLKIQKCGLRCGLAYHHEMEMAAVDPFPKLETLYIADCMEMSQMIISSSSPDAPLQGMCIFQNLSHLTIRECPRLRQMIISSSSPDAPLQGMCIFQNLLELEVWECLRLTHLFWSKQAKHMQQLTLLDISYCESLRAVVISNENQEEGASTSTSTSTTACVVVDHHGSQCSFFPQLKQLILEGLPNIAAFHQPMHYCINCLWSDHVLTNIQHIRMPRTEDLHRQLDDEVLFAE